MKKVNCVHDGIVCTALGEAFCFWTLILLIPICPRIGSPSQHPFSENVILRTSILLSWVIFKIYIVLHCTCTGTSRCTTAVKYCTPYTRAPTRLSGLLPPCRRERRMFYWGKCYGYGPMEREEIARSKPRNWSWYCCVRVEYGFEDEMQRRNVVLHGIHF